jgi:hypothetical protein
MSWGEIATVSVVGVAFVFTWIALIRSGTNGGCGGG